MKKTKELSLNTKKKNTSKTIRSSGPKLKPRLVMYALAHNTWLRHAPKFKTDAETKTESTNSLISTRGKKLKQTTSTPSRRRSPTSTRKKCRTSRLHRKITTPEQQRERNTHQSANPNDSQKLDTAIDSFNKRMTLIEKYMEKVSRYIDN